MSPLAAKKLSGEKSTSSTTPQMTPSVGEVKQRILFGEK